MLVFMAFFDSFSTGVLFLTLSIEPNNAPESFASQRIHHSREQTKHNYSRHNYFFVAPAI